MAGVPSLLVSTLDQLLADPLKRFRWNLSHDVPKGFKHIPRGQLENRDVPDTVDQLLSAYGKEGAVVVTLHTLKKIDQNDLAQGLEKDYRKRLSSGWAGPPDVRIVLVGKSGAGKSSSGNTILGREAFKSKFSPGSVTQNSEKQNAEIEGRRITAIDTPGIFDTSLPEEQVKCEIDNCISLSVPGPHAFLLVIRLGRFTQEERNAVQWIQEKFGEEASRYTMVLFTGGDQLDQPMQEFLSDSSDLQKVVSSCGGGYHVFNNKDRINRTQVLELLEKIEEMVERNGGQHYSNEMYREAERRLRQEEERKRKEKEELKRQEEEKIRAEEERKRVEAERRIREEEERKREEAEKTIREEEEQKREESEKRIREEEARKREEAVKTIREEEERKREGEMQLKLTADQKAEPKFVREVARGAKHIHKFFK